MAGQDLPFADTLVNIVARALADCRSAEDHAAIVGLLRQATALAIAAGHPGSDAALARHTEETSQKLFVDVTRHAQRLRG